MMKNMLLRLIFSGIGCCFISVANHTKSAMNTFRDDTKRNSPATLILRNNTSCFTMLFTESPAQNMTLVLLDVNVSWVTAKHQWRKREKSVHYNWIISWIFFFFLNSHVVGKQKLLTSLHYVFSPLSTALYVLISAASHVTPKTTAPSKWPVH